jgi:hypothetical protein
LGPALVSASPPSIPALTVQGILQSGEFLGPPGNGDNPAGDRVEATYYLQLPAPLAKQVHPASQLALFSPPAQTASFIQLVVFDEEQSVARTLVGKKVRVVGTVLEPDSGPQHTPALIQVRSLSAIRDWQW